MLEKYFTKRNTLFKENTFYNSRFSNREKEKMMTESCSHGFSFIPKMILN
jgi:hypothetical protein